MRTFFILLLGITAIACESRLSQEQILGAPVVDEEFFSNSLAALEKSLLQNPGSSELYFQKAWLLYQLAVDGSLLAIDHALELNSEKPDYFFLKALIHKKAGQDSLALENAQQAERLGENRTELFELLAEIHFEQENYLETLNYTNQLIKVKSGDSRSFLLKSKALLGLHDTVRAEYFLREALENDNDAVQAVILAIRIFMSRLEYDTASVLLKKALIQHPGNSELILQTGDWLEADGRLDSAEDVWRRLSSRPGYQIRSWRKLSDGKYGRGQYDSARYYSDRILAHRPEDLSAHLTLARVADKQGNFALATDQYQGILARDSTHQIAQNELDILNRKVAYLHKIRREFEQQKSQISTITPKKPD